MNCNISPIAFYSSRAAQVWRSGYYQRNIAIVTGENLPAFIINDAPATPPDTVEIYDPNTDTLVATRTGVTDILSHTSTVDGVSVNSWIYQATSAGIWGFTTPGYYYLKIGNYYSDIIKFGAVVGDYVKLTYQFYDDIITADGTLISKYIVYRQIFETVLWHPTYETTEEGKENNGIFYAMQQTLKKMCGFTEIVNTAQLDTLNLTRMADIVNIEARSNGVIRNFTTNTFEITDKWESDEIASIQVSFDLFNIVRKYQKSNVAPEPLPVPTPPPPPSNYIIRGKATGTNVHLKINGTDTTLPVTNGEFYYTYDTPLLNIATYNYTSTHDYPLYQNRLSGVENITEIDFSQSCGLVNARLVAFPFMYNCTKANFSNCTFATADNVNGFLGDAKKLTSLQLPDATFANVKQCMSMFSNCEVITSISLPKATISYVNEPIDGGYLFNHPNQMFDFCYKVQSISMPLSTFAGADSATRMFESCRELKTINMPLATFANVKYMDYMFCDANIDGGSLDWGTLFPACVSQPINVAGMFYLNKNITTVDLTDLDMTAVTSMYWTFYDSNVHDLTMSAAQFASVTDFERCFANCELTSSIINVLATVTFSNATNTKEMFKGCGIYHGSGSLSLTAATFTSVTNAESMFEESKFVNLYLSNASFSSLTNANKMFYGCSAIVIDISSALFTSVSSANSFLLNCTQLTNLHVPNSASWPLSFSMAQSANLNVATMTEIAGWCKYLSLSDPQQSVTVNGTAKARWLADSGMAATYNAAVSTLTNKNWRVQ